MKKLNPKEVQRAFEELKELLLERVSTDGPLPAAEVEAVYNICEHIDAEIEFWQQVKS